MSAQTAAHAVVLPTAAAVSGGGGGVPSAAAVAAAAAAAAAAVAAATAAAAAAPAAPAAALTAATAATTGPDKCHDCVKGYDGVPRATCVSRASSCVVPSSSGPPPCSFRRRQGEIEEWEEDEEEEENEQCGRPRPRPTVACGESSSSCSRTRRGRGGGGGGGGGVVTPALGMETIVRRTERDGGGWRWRWWWAMCVITVWTLLVVVQPCSANPDAKRLYDDLLSSYNRLIRPVGNNSDRLTVKLGLKLSQLIDVVPPDWTELQVTEFHTCKNSPTWRKNYKIKHKRHKHAVTNI
ncbi:uncharacterized protein LOC143028849 [Oratosquilla oratoria]|uniref:uncharacterized protein LOC143028849 n=1 Tax=Oratosquilla oratoria TaxID=337810 RepID=UPI003F75C1D2